MEQNTGKLLFDESPLIVQKKLAMKLGVDEALFTQQLHYLIVNKQNGSDFSTVKEGYVWVYNAWWGWQEFFPFWNEKKIKRMIKKLEDQKVLVGRSDLNVKGYDKTKWYRIDYDILMSIDETNYFEKEGKKEKEKKLERILNPKGQNVLMSNTKGSKQPKKEKEHEIPCDTPKGQNVPIEKDKMSLPIPKTSIPKISLLKDLVSKYVSVTYSPVEFFVTLINDKPSKYVKIELDNLEKEYGKDLVNEAIKRLADKNTTKYIAFLKGVLKKWSDAGAKSLEDVKKIEEEYIQQLKQKQSKGKPSGNQKKSQHSPRTEMVPDWLNKKDDDKEESGGWTEENIKSAIEIGLKYEKDMSKMAKDMKISEEKMQEYIDAITKKQVAL